MKGKLSLVSIQVKLVSLSRASRKVKKKKSCIKRKQILFLPTSPLFNVIFGNCMPNKEGHNCCPEFWYDSNGTLKLLHCFVKDVKIKGKALYFRQPSSGNDLLLYFVVDLWKSRR